MAEYVEPLRWCVFCREYVTPDGHECRWLQELGDPDRHGPGELDTADDDTEGEGYV